MRQTVLVFAILTVAACGGGDDYQPPPSSGPGASASAGEGLAAPSRVLSDEEAQRMLVNYCSRCHSLDRIKRTGRPLDEWCVTVQRMIDKPDGALIGDSDASALANYLTRKYGK